MNSLVLIDHHRRLLWVVVLQHRNGRASRTREAGFGSELSRRVWRPRAEPEMYFAATGGKAADLLATVDRARGYPDALC